MCTVTLTLEVIPWVKVMTLPWVMDNNCVKYYPDRTGGYEVMAWIQCEQMDRQMAGQTDRRPDRQTGRVFPIYPQTLFAGLCLRGV